MVATYLRDRWFFIFGFSKNEKSNVSAEELDWLKNFSQRLLSLNDLELSMALEAGELHEIKPEIF